MNSKCLFILNNEFDEKNDRDSFYDSFVKCVTFAIQDEIRSDS